MKSLENIIETLIINGTLTEHPGLFYGKTGIAIFFFHYARHTGNEIYQEYAFDLINEIQKQITESTPLQYDVGLAGIGVGFEYLLQNGFIEADDDLFEDFDARMYRIVMYEPNTDLSLERGLTGWGRYLFYRIRNKKHKNDKLYEVLIHIAKEILQKVIENSVSESEQPDVFRFLYELTTLPEYAEKYGNILQQCRKWKCVQEPDMKVVFPYMNKLQRLYICQNYFNLRLTGEIKKEWEKWVETVSNIQTDMGLLKGWAAEGMLHLTLSDRQDNSWLNLL